MPEYKPKKRETTNLSGRSALITGGARRIGARIAQTLHAAGMDVVIHYRSSAEAARALQKKLNTRRKNSCILIQCDLSEHNQLKPLIERSVHQLGRLDALINNASAFFPTDDHDTELVDWSQLIDTNLKAPYYLMQAAAPHLQKHRGCIVNLIDIYAQRPLQDHAVYCASKAGLASLTRSFAQSLAPGVRVNGISPGAILWPENQHDEVAQKRQLSRTPLKQLGDPQDIADATLYLIRDASYVTGQILAVDGGRSVMP